jgi:hypothetical protein
MRVSDETKFQVVSNTCQHMNVCVWQMCVTFQAHVYCGVCMLDCVLVLSYRTNFCIKAGCATFWKHNFNVHNFMFLHNHVQIFKTVGATTKLYTSMP